MSERAGRETEAGVEGAQRGRWLRISARDLATGHTKVSLRLPIGLADVALRLGAEWLPGASAADAARLLDAVRDGETGSVVVSENAASGERLEVAIE